MNRLYSVNIGRHAFSISETINHELCALMNDGECEGVYALGGKESVQAMIMVCDARNTLKMRREINHTFEVLSDMISALINNSGCTVWVNCMDGSHAHQARE